MNPNFLHFLKSNKTYHIRKIVVGLIIAVGSAILGLIFPQLISDNWVIIVEIGVGILLIAIFILILTYHNTKIAELETALAAHQNDDIIVLKKEKTISITKESLNELHYCDISTEIVVENNMNTRYDKYLFGIESDCYVPSFNEINIQEDGKKETKLPPTSEYVMKIHKIYNPENQTEKDISKIECDFYVPLNIDPGHIKTLTVKYPTQAFKKIFASQREETSMKVTSKTNNMRFNILLDASLHDNYELSDEKNINRDGEHISFMVTDSSKRRMLKYEKELNDNNCKPHINKHHIKWIIPHPLIGCTYTLYFTLIPVTKKNRKNRK